MSTQHPRRRFLKDTLACSTGLAIGGGAPAPWLHALARQASAHDASAANRILLVIQLSGGNDGLNTVIPYSHDAYRAARPKLALPANEILKIDEEIGLHPTLGGVQRLLEKGRMAIVQGVGYPNPNRSHFESMDIWHTCHRKEDRTGEGWLGRMIAAEQVAARGEALGLHLGSEQQPLALACRGVQVPSIASIEQFRLKVAEDGFQTGQFMQQSATAEEDNLLGFLEASTATAIVASNELNKSLKEPDNSADFPSTQLGEKLRTVSRLIVSGLSTKVYYVTLDGFDTHSLQPQAHAGLLRQWSDALEAFVLRLEQAGQADRVLVMTFSEFGRRVAENASQGTDHGAAAPVFFAGASLPTPLIGQHPDLEDLDDGDLKFHTDFRSIYASVIEKWFEAPSQPILGQAFPSLSII